MDDLYPQLTHLHAYFVVMCETLYVKWSYAVCSIENQGMENSAESADS